MWLQMCFVSCILLSYANDFMSSETFNHRFSVIIGEARAPVSESSFCSSVFPSLSDESQVMDVKWRKKKVTVLPVSAVK